MRSDDDIKRDVEIELRWDPDIGVDDITGVTVKKGIVTLTGFVRSYTDKFEAETAAKRVAGVVGLANDLEVRLPGVDERPDPDIAQDAVAMLKNWLPGEADHIKVTVKDGWLTLEGEVQWHFQQERAENAVRHLKGVKSVSNLIGLKPQIKPTEVKRRIEEAFRRSAQVDADHITVEAHGGEVTLKGHVRSWAERQEAERTAWLAPGVTKVDDRIAISP